MTNTNISNILDAIRTLLTLGEEDLLIDTTTVDHIYAQVHDIDEDGYLRALNDSDYIHYIEDVFMTAATEIIKNDYYLTFIFGNDDLLVTWGYESDYLEAGHAEGGR